MAGSVPTNKHSNTSVALGNNIKRVGSCGWRGNSAGALPKNTWRMKRAEYATLNMPARVAIAGKAIRSHNASPAKMVSAKNISLDRKPFNNGTPAMAAAATQANVAVIGMAGYNPPRRCRSLVPVS
jgi:hypothetical protein